jgi:hypothetical protein
MNYERFIIAEKEATSNSCLRGSTLSAQLLPFRQELQVASFSAMINRS